MGPEHGQPDGGTPLVSVIIPTCNRRAVLERCLEALSRQTYRNLEVIVVDDASIDNTAEMLEAFASNHSSIRLSRLRNEANSGANFSRNQGVRAARGDILAFLDSDCIAAPDWLEKLVRGFANERVAAVTGLVSDPPSQNVYERVLRGVTRVHGRGEAARLVGGNMALRKERMTAMAFDDDPRWRSNRSGLAVSSPVCDEENIYLQLRAQGWSQRVVPDAVVLHEHHYDRRSFFQHAWSGGRAAAYLVYKYRLQPRLDLLPLWLAYVTLPLTAIAHRLVWVSVFFFAAAMAAWLYNELARKAKALSEALYCFPLVIIYYHVRLCGYLVEAARLRLGLNRCERVRLTK